MYRDLWFQIGTPFHSRIEVGILYIDDKKRKKNENLNKSNIMNLLNRNQSERSFSLLKFR